MRSSNSLGRYSCCIWCLVGVDASIGELLKVELRGEGVFGLDETTSRLNRLAAPLEGVSSELESGGLKICLCGVLGSSLYAGDTFKDAVLMFLCRVAVIESSLSDSSTSFLLHPVALSS